MPTYTTIDNGRRPFKVVIDEKKVSIFKGEDIEYSKLVKVYPLTVGAKVFVGKSSGKARIADHGSNPRLSPKHFDGNSILIAYPQKCVFIGHEVTEFALPDRDRVEAYYSPHGPNDVPYPLIVGEKNVYFMLDYEYLSRAFILGKMMPLDWENMYDALLGKWDPKKKVSVGSLQPLVVKMKGVKIISPRF